MLEAIVAGVALGAVYALLAGGMTVSYTASGVLNFAYGSIAYITARLYFFLRVQHHWGIVPAAILSILVFSPVLGVLLWAILFRFLSLAPELIKIVVMVGLAVCIPPVTILLFGSEPAVTPPGLAPQPVATYHFAGAVVTLDQLLVYIFAIVILGGGAALLRWTDAGLLVRATVDSEAMASLAGIKPARVSMSVWAISTFIAGLAGVLIAPVVGLAADSFTVLVAAAFAAVVAAKLHRLGIAVLVGLLMGIATELAETYLPSNSTFTADAIPSIPFLFLLIFLLYFAFQRGTAGQQSRLSGALDRAIAPQSGGIDAEARASLVGERSSKSTSLIMPVGFIVVVAILPMILSGAWQGEVGLGAAYGVAFLAYTISAGSGGMIWLCQITFAGIGAFATAEFATNLGMPVLLAMVVGGLVCAAIGVIIGFLTIRLGDLYVALVTLTFGLLVEKLIFQLPSLYNLGSGVSVDPPGFAMTARNFSWLALAIFVILALLHANMRRSTFGLAVGSVRWSPAGARAIGLSVIVNKVTLGAFSAFVAGIGGALLSMYALAAVPAGYSTFTGLSWLAIVVTFGVGSSSAALLAGLAFSFLPAVFAAYLPTSWGEVPPALFGLGAILVVHNPDGTLAMHARQLEGLVRKWARGGTQQRSVAPADAAPMAAAAMADNSHRNGQDAAAAVKTRGRI
jgi:branched-chain amino acid transport system permease protein